MTGVVNPRNCILPQSQNPVHYILGFLKILSNFSRVVYFTLQDRQILFLHMLPSGCSLESSTLLFSPQIGHIRAPKKSFTTSSPPFVFQTLVSITASGMVIQIAKQASILMRFTSIQRTPPIARLTFTVHTAPPKVGNSQDQQWP